MMFSSHTFAVIHSQHRCDTCCHLANKKIQNYWIYYIIVDILYGVLA